MKIIAVNGSPRGKTSISYLMVEAFLQGFRENGWEDEHILLSEMKIHHCIGCFHCWRTGKGCVFHDDMDKIGSLSCDIFLLATPIYCDMMTGLLKNFLDRLVARGNPKIERSNGQECVHPHEGKREKLIVMSNCGFPESTHFQALSLWAQRYARNRETELIAEIYRSTGPILHAEDPKLRSLKEKYLLLLQEAGREVAQIRSLSPEMSEKLSAPLLSCEEYLAWYNSFL